MAGDQQRFDEGAAAYDAGNYTEAYAIFLDLADRDDIAAMRNVALMKRKGQGTAVDLEGARDYLERAADAGLPTAQYDLALMMLDGEGGDPDPKDAVRLLQGAVSAHHPFAALRLGEIYEEGKLVRQDVAKAESLYAQAAERGVKEAADRLAALQASQPQPAAQSAPATMPTARQAATNGTGAFALQIGAYRSEAEAEESWRAYSAAHPAAAAFAPAIRQADLAAKGIWYRLQIGPFASAGDAVAFCAKLKASGGTCFPVRQ